MSVHVSVAKTLNRSWLVSKCALMWMFDASSWPTHGTLQQPILWPTVQCKPCEPVPEENFIHSYLALWLLHSILYWLTSSIFCGPEHVPCIVVEPSNFFLQLCVKFSSFFGLHLGLTLMLQYVCFYYSINLLVYLFLPSNTVSSGLFS